MSLRPDLVECWLFRVPPPTGPADARPDAERLEILLIRRSATRIFPGLWQCVTGGVEPGERVPMAAIREVEEETGLRGADVEGWYDLDQVAPFFDEGVDGIVVSARSSPRAIRPEATVRVSHEHDAPALGPGGRGAGAGDLAVVRRVGAPDRATCSSTRRWPAGSRWTPTAAGSPAARGRDGRGPAGSRCR